MTHRRRQRSYTKMHDINITNLVDVILVILIVFMICAPLMQSGINVNLPQTKVVDATLSDGVVVTIDKQGLFYIDDRLVDSSQFEEKVKEAYAFAANKSVFLRADKSVTHGYVVEAMGLIKAAGISEVGLVTKFPETEHRFAEN
jgi:biopolymer transport protein TolR